MDFFFFIYNGFEKKFLGYESFKPYMEIKIINRFEDKGVINDQEIGVKTCTIEDLSSKSHNTKSTVYYWFLNPERP